MALDKQRLLAENDFGKLLNFVVADGQTLDIVFLLNIHTDLSLLECFYTSLTETMR